MGVHWRLLNDEERERFNAYDLTLVALLSERIRFPSQKAEEKIKNLHDEIDDFIVQLEHKYRKKVCRIPKRCWG